MDGGNPWGDLAGQGPVIALLLGFLFGFSKEYWVFGWTYKAIKEDRDYWRDQAVKQLETVDKAIEAPKPETRRRTTRAASD